MQIKEGALPSWVYTMLEKAYPSDETVMRVMRHPEKVRDLKMPVAVRKNVTFTASVSRPASSHLRVTSPRAAVFTDD